MARSLHGIFLSTELKMCFFFKILYYFYSLKCLSFSPLQSKCKEWHVGIKAKLCCLEFCVRSCSNLLWSKTFKGHQTTEHQFKTDNFSKGTTHKMRVCVYIQVWNLKCLNPETKLVCSWSSWRKGEGLTKSRISREIHELHGCLQPLSLPKQVGHKSHKCSLRR